MRFNRDAYGMWKRSARVNVCRNFSRQNQLPWITRVAGHEYLLAEYLLVYVKLLAELGLGLFVELLVARDALPPMVH